MSDSVSSPYVSAHNPLCGLSQPCDEETPEHGYCSMQHGQFCIHCHQWCVCERMRKAEKHGYEKAVAEFMSNHGERWEYRAGQADMLAKCVAAVEEIIPDDSDSGSWEATIAAAWLRHAVSKLRALEDKL